MIAFEFSRVDKNVPANEFDQGDITFTIGEIKVSSAKEINRFSMIYLSITLLVDGLVGIKRRFEFIAVDSSFCIGFNKSKKYRNNAF
ncbi:hypothetical protein ACIQUF_24885 [Pseudomonas sp. NPDC090233]|uniref:hypothetical protein n=1 Tax=Pseudomonas sp. NPDC090233 TaxID=3364479 RepID=UPI00383A0B21